MSDFHCPLCNTEIDHLDYAEEGTYALNPDGTFDDRDGCVNAGRVSCPVCHGELEWSLEDDTPTIHGAWSIDEDVLRTMVERFVVGQVPSLSAYDRMMVAGAEYYAWCYGESLASFVELWDERAAGAHVKMWRDMTSDERHETLARVALLHFDRVANSSEGWFECMEGFVMDAQAHGLEA